MIDTAALKDTYSKKSVIMDKTTTAHSSSPTLKNSSLKTAVFLPAFLLTPTLAFANAEATFGNIYNAVMNMFDGATVLIIIFAGASWMLGHRSRAIELLIGACCGYLLARHAVDIRDFLKTI